MKIDTQRMKNLAKNHRFHVGLLVCVALVCGLLLGTVVSGRGAGPLARAMKDDSATPLAIPDPVHLSGGFAAIAETVEPAVVNISTTAVHKAPKRPTMPRGFDQSPFGDFWNRFFQFPDMGPMTEHALGSGVIVDKKGYVLTNNHVVDGATKIQVQLNGQSTKYTAKVVGTDEETDLAVLKINADRELPVAKLGNSNSVRVGDWVLAVGSPFGLRATVTAGIISAKDRNGITGKQFQRFLQTDAAINPGNSGGPLVDLAGQVIGINTAIETQSGGYQGVGFALPSNTAIRIYNDLVEHGKVTRGSIGVSFQEEQSTNPVVLKQLGAEHGIIIESVQPGSPASRAGLKGGDVITAVNGNPVKTGDDLVNAVTSAPLGSKMEINYVRDRKEKKASVTIESRDEVFSGNSSAQDNSSPGESSPAKFGLHVENLSSERARQLGMEGQRGVVVADVDSGSFAEDIGFQQGDVIVEVNQTSVETYNALREKLERLHTGDEVVFKVLRQDQDRGLLTLFLAGNVPS
jgi:serine protease Do